MTRADFYVYVLLRHDGVPFYVGKGCGGRWLQHERDALMGANGRRFSIIREMYGRGVVWVPKLKVCDGLTEEEANAWEIAVIAAIGRWPMGPLVNVTRGGDGGKRRDEESRRKTRSGWWRRTRTWMKRMG